MQTDFDNRYPDWIPISYELRAEYALENPQSDYTGMPSDINTRAWDRLITRSFVPLMKVSRLLR